MAEQNPLYLNLDDVYGASALGLPFRDIIGQGIVGSGDLLVSASTPNAMSVSVAKGAAWVAGDDDANLQPTYRVYNDAAETLNIAPADPVNARHDLIVARVYDTTFGDIQDAFKLEVVEGTPAGTPLDPALPNNALLLARVIVGAAVGNIASGNINDLRLRAGVGAGQAMNDILITREVGSVAEVNTTTTTDWFAGGLVIPAGLIDPSKDEVVIEVVGQIKIASATSPTHAFTFSATSTLFSTVASAFAAAGSGVFQPFILTIRIRPYVSTNVEVTAELRLIAPSTATSPASGQGSSSLSVTESAYLWRALPNPLDLTQQQTLHFYHTWGTANANNEIDVNVVRVRKV